MTTTTTAASWSAWLTEHNRKYRAMSNEQKLCYLRDFLGSMKTTPREQTQIQEQIDALQIRDKGSDHV
jgi:hypothetical protein